MSIETIPDPLRGERVVALSPGNALQAASAWLRRPNLFPGRALSAATLAQRQRWQAGHIASRAQDWLAGVVDGLELSAAPIGEGTGFGATRLRVERGRGLALSGEDLVLTRALECRLADVPVVAPPGFFNDGSGVGDPVPDGSLRARRVGSELGALAPAALAALPAVGVLLLQPVQVDSAPLDGQDPCDRSACSEGAVDDVTAFEDWRVGDAVRLLWYVWPTEWRGLQATDAQQRNHLAWQIFQAEEQLADDDALPWESFGLPLALVRLDAQQRPLWLDRASVVRAGGRVRHGRLQRVGGAAVAGRPRLAPLWQARIEQLAEQIAAAGDPAPPVAELRNAFGRFLPPAGLLPASAYTPATRRSEFFPSGFDLDAVPVPVDQLDLALRASAGLAPLAVGAAESVRLLVPVPLASWEPRLLVTEVIDPAFQATLDRFLLVRSRALGARQGLRLRDAMLQRGLQGRLPELPRFDEDPLALEVETLQPWGPPPAGGGHRSVLRAGLHQHSFERATETFLPTGDRLYCWVYLDPDHPPRTLMLQWHSAGSWEHRAFWGENLVPLGSDGTVSRLRLGELPTAGRWTRLEVPLASVGLSATSPLDGMAFTLHDGRAAYGMAGSLGTGQPAKWFCNVLPAGAQRFGDEPWELLTHNDLWAPFEPTLGVLPTLDAALPPTPGAHHDGGAQGLHQHALEQSPVTFTPATNDTLFCWVYADPNNPPRQLMLQWRPASGAAASAAFWGFDLIGQPGLAVGTRVHAGALPQPGRWLRLEVSARALGLEGVALQGLAFVLFDGHAVFGANGAGQVANGTFTERVWFAGSPPAGASTRGHWNEVAARDLRSPTPSVKRGQVQALDDLYASASQQGLSPQECAQLYLLGVEGFVAYLTARADRADDVVDYGFVKVQTDLYRVRQLVLGTTAATRLAVSPALADIARTDAAVASQAQIASFVADLKAGAAAPANPSTVPRGARAAPATVTLSRAGGAALFGGSASAAVLSGPGLNLNLGDRLGSDLALGGRVGAEATVGGITGKTGVQTGGTAASAAKLRAAEVAAAGDLSPIVRGRGGAASTFEVVNAQPVVGQSFVRTTTIAQRLGEPKSKEARDYATSSRFEAVQALVRLYESLTAEDGGTVPGLFEGLSMRGLAGDGFLDDLPEGQDGQRPLQRPLADLLRNRTLVNRLLTVPSRLPAGTASGDPDEAALFSDATDLSDHVVALMRQVEARIKRYRDAVAACQPVLAGLREARATLASRQRALADDLAEARHDVSVTRSLMAEETERLAALNARRARVLAEEVKFIAYVRPREADNLRATPTHAVDPGLLEPAVPACLAEHADVPDELDDMLRVVREAPARWFVKAPPLLQRLDRVEPLLRTLQSAQQRVATGLALPLLAVQAVPAAGGGPRVALGSAVAQVATRQRQAVQVRAAGVAQLNLAALATTTWQGLRVQAETLVSFADLAEGGHGRPDVSRAAAAELENIRRVSACLHAEFCAVPPAVRLDWAETLSQFDAAPNLRNLSSLAHWSEIAFEDRRQMQAYVDFLFAQIEAGESAAVALVNDLVRMCLLLASHAPVNRIIAGRLARPVTGVRPGLHIALAASELSRLRVGMQAVLTRNNAVLARARVADVGQAEVSAEVVHTAQPQVDLGEDVRVHFDDNAALSLATASARRSLFGR